MSKVIEKIVDGGKVILPKIALREILLKVEDSLPPALSILASLPDSYVGPVSKKKVITSTTNKFNF